VAARGFSAIHNCPLLCLTPDPIANSFESGLTHCRAILLRRDAVCGVSFVDVPLHAGSKGPCAELWRASSANELGAKITG